MSSNQNTPNDSTETKLTRRSVLGVLATAGGAAALTDLVDGDGPEPERTSLGGNSRESAAAGQRFGGFSFAPSTIPPTGDQLNWTYGDEAGVNEVRAPDSLPATWMANGIQWSVAADLATAEANLNQTPGIAVTPDGNDVLHAADQLPQTWTANGISFVVAETLDDARAVNNETTPAVLWGANGTREVVLDG